MNRATVTAATALAALTILSAQALAQVRKATTVTIVNGRQTALIDLEISNSDEERSVAGKLSEGLAPGKRATLKLDNAKGCVFAIRGVFADDTTTEADDMDLCKDRTLRLTE